MNKTNLVLKMSMAALMASVYSTSASADAIPGDALAQVIQPLTLAEVTKMNFGTIAPTGVASTVTLTPGAGRTGTATLLAGPTTASLGKFTITGDAAQTFNIALSVTGAAANVLLTDGAGNSMTVTGLTENSAVGGVLTGAADAFDIGGTLNVGATQVGGSYSTANAGGVTFTVTANYN